MTLVTDLLLASASANAAAPSSPIRLPLTGESGGRQSRLLKETAAELLTVQIDLRHRRVAPERGGQRPCAVDVESAPCEASARARASQSKRIVQNGTAIHLTHSASRSSRQRCWQFRLEKGRPREANARVRCKSNKKRKNRRRPTEQIVEPRRIRHQSWTRMII